MSLQVERMASEQFAPVNPLPQAHENEATPSIQVPPFMHGFGWQSSWLSWQLSPSQPAKQSQRAPPGLATHTPPFRHLFSHGSGILGDAASGSPVTPSDGKPYEGKPHDALATSSDSANLLQSMTAQYS